MSWNKGAYSYLIWFVYTAVTGCVLSGIAGAFCGRAGITAYWGILFAAIFFAAAGNAVFFLRRWMRKRVPFAEKNKVLLQVLEAALAVTFLVAGLVLRIRGIDGAPQQSVYFEAAKVTEGWQLPQSAHGAVNFYVGMLHAVFVLFGNHFEAGVWLQIVLQLIAFLMLFLVVRRLGGSLAALTALGFCSCGSYMTGNALALSPEALTACIFIAVIALIMAGNRGRLRPELFFLAGIPIAFCCYLDIMGVLVLFLAVAAAFAVRREPSGFGRKAAAAFGCLAGTVLAFFIIICIDAFISGKTSEGVLRAWWLLYRPEGFRLPAFMDFADIGGESLLLAGLMVFGVFGFWVDKKEERMTVCVLGAAGVAAAGCFGIFTEEMPGFLCLYLLLAVLAGLGAGQCFAVLRSGDFAVLGDGEKGLREAHGEAGETPPAKESIEDGTVQSIGKEATVIQDVKDGKPRMFSAEKESVPDAAVRNKPEALSEKRETLTEGEGAARQEDMSKEQAETANRPVRYIENPLPLPKKHEKRVMDFPSRPDAGEDDFDYPVSDEDDFDI